MTIEDEMTNDPKRAEPFDPRFRLQSFDEAATSTPSPEYLGRLVLAKLLAAYARLLDAPPQYECRNRVHVRGDRLSRPVLWRGRQWAVTKYGVECRDGTYCIDADRLDENEQTHPWVRHMAAKEWVDLPDFAEALRIARRNS